MRVREVERVEAVSGLWWISGTAYSRAARWDRRVWVAAGAWPESPCGSAFFEGTAVQTEAEEVVHLYE